MKKNYLVVGEDGSHLSALLKDDPTREIDLTYRDAKGNKTMLTIRNKLCISEKGFYADGELSDHGCIGYLVGVHDLGPELRAQLPDEWHPVLGEWLEKK